MTNIDCTAAIKADPATSEQIAQAAWARWANAIGFTPVTMSAAFARVRGLTGAEFHALRAWGLLGDSAALSDGTPTFRLFT